MKKVLLFSKGESLGSELITNGNFDSGSTGWLVLGSATVSGGKGNLNGDLGNSLIGQSILTNGKTYRVSFDVSNFVDALGLSRVINNNGNTLYNVTSNGSKTFDFTHTIANANLFWRGDSGDVYSIDNVSVKEIL